MIKKLLFLSYCLQLCASTNAQCLSGFTPLENRFAQSELVVVAQVLQSSSFYDKRGHIATRHQLQLHEIWQGDTSLQCIEIVTLGGQFQEEMLVVHPNLNLQAGDIGLFFLKQHKQQGLAGSPKDLHGSRASDYYPISVNSGFLRFDTLANMAYDQGQVFPSLAALADQLLACSGSPHRHRAITNQLPPRGAANGNGRSPEMMPLITSFSPTSLAAGTNQTLTINGSGFGSSPGFVLLDSPNDGPGNQFSVLSGSVIQSWSDTQITVNVTDAAGTGRVGVRNSSGQTAFSTNNLTITYAIVSLIDPSGNFINGRLIDDEADSNGGYILLASTSTANGGVSLADHTMAMLALERAISTWQSQTGYAIYAGAGCGTTSVQIPAEDGVNIISFDNDAYDMDVQIGNDVVGVTFSYYNLCGSSAFEITEVDMILRRDGNPNGFGGSVSWYFGSGVGSGFQTNFEAIALHELGHALQLNHVNDASQSMFYTSNSASPITSLGNSDMTGAAYIQGLAMAYSPPIVNCGAGNDFNKPRAYQFYQPDENCLLAVPVTYLSFTAIRQEKEVQIDWRTATEENNARFVVERSADGRQFQSIAALAGYGSSNEIQQYRIIDPKPLVGMNYYRLAQIDFDGTVAYSDLRSVRFEEEAAALHIFPNPTQQIINIQLSSSPHARDWQLLDTNGRLLQTGRLAASAAQMMLSLHELPTGVYWWKLEGESAQRVVKR